MIHAEVSRHGNENVTGLMRRFTRKAQGSGVVRRVRSLRYHNRTPSATRVKSDALKKLQRISEYQALYKLGREPKSTRRRN
jgi:ribosomal protein S21